MATVSLELPEEIFSALRRSPEEFVREMRLAAAIHWYARGEMSQEKAAQIARAYTAQIFCWLWHVSTSMPLS